MKIQEKEVLLQKAKEYKESLCGQYLDEQILFMGAGYFHALADTQSEITQLKEVNDKLKIGFDKAINRHIQTSLKLQEQVSELKSKLEVAESKSVGKFLDFAGGEYGGLATYTINKAVANFLTKINN